ncbi:MAG: superoxide dismutase, Ni [Acidobacteriota bacterium]|nr:superoxide dismutase, Ni [Acidobacteriota bacterium]
MIKNLSKKLMERTPVQTAEAHCDGPCGVYDPASIRIAAEAAVSMTKKIAALEPPADGDAKAMAAYINTMSRYISIKEEQAHLAKKEMLVLWTDYFKPAHLEQFPNLHDVFWKATKLCSAVKVEVSLEHAQELMDSVKEIHDIFWRSKDRDVEFYLAG